MNKKKMMIMIATVTGLYTSMRPIDPNIVITSIVILFFLLLLNSCKML